MYCYVYDSFLTEKKYALGLFKIEARLTDLGIHGRTERLTILKSIREAVHDAVQKGADTIIAVGNDDTVGKIISILPDHGITFGIIPIGPNNSIAAMLGIPEGEAACDTLSARIIEKIDLGRANNSYFISSLSIPSQHEVVIDCGAYNISPLDRNNSITIQNFGIMRHGQSAYPQNVSNPKDGILEAVIESAPASRGFFKKIQRTYSGTSVFPIRKLKIKCTNESLSVIADGRTTVKTPVTVEVIPKRLKVIVGKGRMF
ncbi:MAG: diacylglycerol kinase family protein [Patescibacteria group bacterium]|nr:diacylglycerol kinase family protein [Patescibacteria group bacterium]MDD5715516.1 diacylglycerol kinase family protein [Patescibacteria group bacterium]